MSTRRSRQGLCAPEAPVGIFRLRQSVPRLFQTENLNHYAPPDVPKNRAPVGNGSIPNSGDGPFYFFMIRYVDYCQE